MISAGKRLHRESSIEADPVLTEKLDNLKDEADRTSKQSADRLTSLEQALPLAQYFKESEDTLEDWLGAIEEDIAIQKTAPSAIDKGKVKLDKGVVLICLTMICFPLFCDYFYICLFR